MALTPEQVAELKKQLSEQIKDLPEEQKAQAQAQIGGMSAEALEVMLKQQLAQQGQQAAMPSGAGPQKSIFRMIVDGDVPSKKIDENNDAVAVVSVKPVSRGHVLVIPKKVIGDVKLISGSVMNLARKVAKKISSKFKPTGTEIQTSNAFGEVVVNVIPVYDKPVNVSSPPYDADEKELEEVYKKLRVVQKKKV
ncbi:MAG: HIT domain-containing protein [Nanoarchaeota archaeon]|nr:HIT domain-containing protein [Nanoarchaeota archaeon]